MCTKNQLEVVLQIISQHTKELFGDKLFSIILYGSYARGDYDTNSDIDIMILADISQKDCHSYSMELGSRLSDTELEYDILISLNVVSLSIFRKYKSVLPFYNIVEKEGLVIAV